MPIYIAAESELNVGQPLVLEAQAEQGDCTVVFEDDEATGYFYALDPQAKGNPIQDALFIYAVEAVPGSEKPASVKIGWSMDHRKAVLLINGYPHGVFDFDSKRGYCHAGFPPAVNHVWSPGGHEWNDEVLKLFA